MDELNQLSLLAAIINDDEHKARMNEIMTALRQVQQERMKLAEEQKANAALVQEAKAYAAAGDQAHASAKQKTAEIDRERSGLADANRALNEEKQRWNIIRTTVDREHKEREKSFSDREGRVAAKEGELKAREDTLAQSERSLSGKSAKMAKIHQSLKQHAELIAQL